MGKTINLRHRAPDLRRGAARGDGLARCHAPLRAFARDQDGTITPFTIILFLIMLVAVGMGVDLMRHESIRAEMQNALDRGLLAAADLDQKMDSELTVKEYFRTAMWVGDDTVIPQVDVETSNIKSREITGSATYEMPTIFMRLVGFPKLTVAAAARAEEHRKNLEISLVMDISGTMRWCQNNSSNCPDGNRIQKLIPAAQDFVDKLLAEGNEPYTTISLVPYAGQVNPGPALFERLGGERTYDHNGSSCMELEAADFDYLELPRGGSYEQVPHFHNWTIEESWMEWGWCPSNAVAATLMSNDRVELNDSIEALRTNLHDGTGTNFGLRWGLGLLDPGSKDELAPLVPAEFSGARPADYGDQETLKFIVLMTDGQITEQVRPTDPWDEDNADEELKEQDGDASTQNLSQSDARNQFLDLCQEAYDRGIVVFTIAYLAPTSAQNEMRDCAYDPDTHFYNIADLDVAYAFRDIATTINKIRLVR